MASEWQLGYVSVTRPSFGSPRSQTGRKRFGYKTQQFPSHSGTAVVKLGFLFRRFPIRFATDSDS
jgi:hypothetical protein